MENHGLPLHSVWVFSTPLYYTMAGQDYHPQPLGSSEAGTVSHTLDREKVKESMGYYAFYAEAELGV